MNHLGFIAASYALGLLVPLWFAVTAATRTAAAKRRLAVLDTRRRAGPSQV